jgi:hypothetical protein
MTARNMTILPARFRQVALCASAAPPTDAECIESGAHSLGVTVAEFCTLKIVSAAVVAQAKCKFRTMVRGLPSGSPITWKIMDTWAKTHFRQYRWDDVVINACMPEAAKLAGEGMLRPVSPLFNTKGDQLHDNYTRA